MAGNLRPYQNALRAVEVELQAELANGRESPSEVAIARRTLEIMRSQLQSSPNSVLQYDRLPRDRFSFSGPQRWRLTTQQKAREELFPHLASDAASAAYTRKWQEYLDLGLKLVRSPDMRYRAVVDRKRGRSYLYRENPLVPKIMQIIAHELMDWYEHYPIDRDFYRRGWFLTWSAEAGMGLFLEERPDIVALLRLTQKLPLDVEVSEIPIERPLIVEAVELGIGLVPVVGNIVAAYEAYSGEDLFGYRLTEVERGILAASVLLPLAGRVVKGGRVLYSEARLMKLYGGDAAAWSRTLQAGGNATANGSARLAINDAETLIRTQRRLDRALAQKAVNALTNLVRGRAPVSTTVDRAVVDLFRQLSSRYKVLAELDEFAIHRILSKGPNVNHLKGQLLEEMIESRVVPWLRDRAGTFALGIQTGGKQLEFISGHLIRDASGRQITDGILAFRNKGVLEIAAIFEAKAGKQAARELSLSSSSLSSLSQVDRAELRAYARDVWRTEQGIAQQAGKSFGKTIDEIEKEIVLSERGGQIRRDVERLSKNANGTLPQIYIGAEAMPVQLSPTRTKFFGVLPRDVNRSLIERELREAGFSFEIIGVDIGQRDLQSIATDMISLATSMVE